MKDQCLPESWEELKTLFLTTFQSNEDVSTLMKKMSNLHLRNGTSIDAHTDQFESMRIQAQIPGHSEWVVDCYLSSLPLHVNEMTCIDLETNRENNPNITTVYVTARRFHRVYCKTRDACQESKETLKSNCTNSLTRCLNSHSK